MSSLKKLLPVFMFTLLLLLTSVWVSLSFETAAAKLPDFITPSPQPTRIPLPNPPKSIHQVKKLIANDSCQLPCFWGFQPNYTTAEEILSFVDPRENFSNLPVYEISYLYQQKDPDFVISFSVKDQILSSLEVIIENPADWLPTETLELSEILIRFKTSPDIYLAVNTGQRRLFLTLVYNEAGMLFQYAFDLKVHGNVMSPNIDEPLLLCSQPEFTDFIRFWLHDDDGNQLLEENIIGFQASSVNNHNWPVEQMSEFTKEAFIEAIITHPDECVELFSYPELAEQGYEF